MKKTIRDYKLYNKKVIIRVDFNVPIQNGRITDDNRIQESLPTIRYAIEKGAKVVLLSHMGRIQAKEDCEKYDLEPIAYRLSELLNQEVIFVNATRGALVEDAIAKLEDGQVLLLQNTRYEDLDGKKESNNDSELGAYWASLGEIFINDAFGTSHRAHASNVGIASHLPSGIGFLIEKELEVFQSILECPNRPFTVILGGSKVSDKIEVIQNLVTQADQILIGGGMAYTFLKASGIPIGKSLCDLQHIDFCKEILEKYPSKIILPIDSINAKEINEEGQERFIMDFKEDEMGLDIGYHTIKLFADYLKNSRTILWNGPVGMYEHEAFAKGTSEICRLLEENKGITVVGGGDTAAAVLSFSNRDSFTHISTGGGASLELLEGKKLPGIESIYEK